MQFHLKFNSQQTLVPAELLEIYQPVLGYEAIAVWLNLYHALLNGQGIAESDLLEQMNIPQRTFRSSINELKKYKLMETEGKDTAVVLPPMPASEMLEFLNSGTFSPEQERRLITLIQSFRLRRGMTGPEEDEPAEIGETSTQFTEQQADEFATRFIKECNFIPNRQLRERFDLWFDQIRDSRLLEELLERTKRKVQLEGSKGACPSLYADKIVRQWLVQGIRTYADLTRVDQEFHARWEYYRIVEKELGRSFNSLTPAEKDIVDKWAGEVNEVNELSTLLKQAILSGEYQGKGAPSLAFIDTWLNRKAGNKDKPASSKKKTAFIHQHKISDLQKVVQRKTMIGLGDDYEG